MKLRTLLALGAIGALALFAGCGGSSDAPVSTDQGHVRDEDRHRLSELPPDQRDRLREMQSETGASK